MIVAFDFDGTLAASFNLVNRCIIQVAKDNGIFLKESDLIPYYGPTEEGMINNILKSDNRANFKKYLQYYSEYHNIELNRLNPYVNELLDHLKDKGVNIILLTGRSKESTDISLAYFGLNKYFTKVYTGSKNGSNKAFNFTKVMKDFSCSSKDIIYIGDSKKDVLECQKSNIKILSINFDNERLAKIKEINNFSYSSFIELEKELNKYL